jgi:hypothetical protein
VDPADVLAMEVRTWDCGGQLVYKQTNRIFFGRRRAVYVAVYNLRTQITSEFEDTLHDVRCYAPNAPVVLVGTHLDLTGPAPRRVEKLRRDFPMIRCVANVSSAAPGQSPEQEQRSDQMRGLLRDLREQALGLPGVEVELPRRWRLLQLWLTAAAQPAAGQEKAVSNLFRTVAEVQTAAVAECGFGEGDTASVTQALALFHDWGYVVDARAARPAGAAAGHHGGSGGGSGEAGGSTASMAGRGMLPLEQPVDGGIVVIDPPAVADVMKRVVTAAPGNLVRAQKGVLQHADLAHVWAEYPTALHAPLLDLLHTFEVAFPLRNTQGEPLGASVIVPMLGSMEEALQERNLDHERESAVRDDGATQLFVRFAARVQQQGGGGAATGGGAGAEGGGGGGVEGNLNLGVETRFPPDFVGRLLVRLHRFAMCEEGDGGNCRCAWDGGCILGYADNKALLQLRHCAGAEGDVLDLTVWGVYPATLRNIVYRAVKLLVEQHYPGIQLDETVLCPCGKNGRKEFEVEELQEQLEAGSIEADSCRQCKPKRQPLRWLLPEGALDDAYLPADQAMQRLEEHVPPPDDPAHALTALAGSNFEAQYVQLRPSLLRVGDRVRTRGGEPAMIVRVHEGHRYDVSSPQRRFQRFCDANGDDLDFTRLDVTARRVQAVPAYRDELLWALRRVVKGYCEWHGKPEAECTAFLQKLYGEWKLEDSVALAAQRLWTSAKKLGGVDNGKGKGVDVGTGAEFCSMWTEVIRRDQASLARPSAIIARALNRQLVGASSTLRAEVAGATDHPEHHCTWRGSGFGVPGLPADDPISPEGLRQFFTVGKTYRVKQCLATSFKESTANAFLLKVRDLAMGGDPKRQLVKWKVALDRRGADDPQFRCKHMQYLSKTHVPGEEEYLFAVFSVFTVTEVEWSADPAAPHRITVEAALDNKLQPVFLVAGVPNPSGGQPWPDDLPLAPWC